MSAPRSDGSGGPIQGSLGRLIAAQDKQNSDDRDRLTITPSSIPQHAVDAAMNTDEVLDNPVQDARTIIAAALNALGCEWDDDQGKNTMRRLVGAWQEKP